MTQGALEQFVNSFSAAADSICSKNNEILFFSE